MNVCLEFVRTFQHLISFRDTLSPLTRPILVPPFSYEYINVSSQNPSKELIMALGNCQFYCSGLWQNLVNESLQGIALSMEMGASISSMKKGRTHILNSSGRGVTMKSEECVECATDDFFKGLLRLLSDPLQFQIIPPSPAGLHGRLRNCVAQNHLGRFQPVKNRPWAKSCPCLYCTYISSRWLQLHRFVSLTFNVNVSSTPSLASPAIGTVKEKPEP